MALEDIGGVHKLYINSVEYILKGDPTFDVGGVKRTPIDTISGKVFSKKEIVHSSISGTIVNTSALDLVALREIKDATIILECPNGKQVVFRNAFFTDDPSVSGSEGEVSFAFAADPAEELMP